MTPKEGLFEEYNSIRFREACRDDDWAQVDLGYFISHSMKITRRILHLCFVLFAATTGCAEEPKYQSIDEAIARGDLQDVQLQLEAYPERAKKGKHPKLAPLHQAILRKKVEIAKALIAAGADVDQPDASKRTPLHLCVDRNLAGVAKALLAAGAKPNEWDKAGWTPLHNAAAKNQLEMSKVLIKGGADLKVLSERGGTPLHEAAASADSKLIQYLLHQGVDPAVKANDGSTAYDVAVRRKNAAAIKLLKGGLSARSFYAPFKNSTSRSAVSLPMPSTSASSSTPAARSF